MNEILKFKALHSIIKALDGTYFRSPNDPNIWINRKTKKAYKSRRWRDADPNNHADDFDRYFEEYDDRPTRFVSQGKTYVRQGDTYYTVDALGHPVSQVSNPQFNWVRDAQGNMRTLVLKRSDITVNNKNYASKSDFVKDLQPQEVVITGDANKSMIRPKATPRGLLYWDNQFATFTNGLTAEQLAWLKDNGLNNARALQTYLDANNYYDSTGNNIDSKFGDNSKAAWSKFVASGIMGKNRDQEIYEQKQKEIEPVLDAADPFGYKTSNTYEGDDFADRLKGMGIRSNADLINFMHNSAKAGWKGDAWQTQFRSDVDRALGGDYSDANIRRTFHTKNGWGGGFLGGGDFTDFQNALQTNAGVWNGMYERKESDARMDAARKQAAERMAKQYVELNPIKLKPIPEELTRKYGVNAKPAASTLGTAGAGTMGKTVKPYDWVEEALKSGLYFPQPETGTEEFVPLDWMLQAAKTGYVPQQ